MLSVQGDYVLSSLQIRGADGKPIELGRGAMGITYKAFDVDLHCPVTQKVISERYVGDESARLRFLRERARRQARAIQTLLRFSIWAKAQPTRNIAGKRRAGQANVDSDYRCGNAQ